jgi:hypothetical protein
VEVKEQKEEQYALIIFKDFISAFFAQQSLNNYYLAKYNATLIVKWMPRETQQGTPKVTQAPQKRPSPQPFIQPRQEIPYSTHPTPNVFESNNVYKQA